MTNMARARGHQLLIIINSDGVPMTIYLKPNVHCLEAVRSANGALLQFRRVVIPRQHEVLLPSTLPHLKPS